MSSKVSNENRAPNLGATMTKKGKTIEEIYTKKTQLEHILLRPDTYVGSIERQAMNMWVLDPETNKIVQRPTNFVPGLYKIFDEIMVNAADNKQRDPSMTKIDVTIDPENNLIRVWNNGNGIPVVIHSEHQIYVPELIFGHLLTGSNFDDEELKTTGGRNGYGAKLANIFSTEFVVETVDSKNGLHFKQTFTGNMSHRAEPVIKKTSSSDFTSITFRPDLARFKMSSLDADIVSLLSKRVYDVAGTNSSGPNKISVSLNGQRIQVKSLQEYLEMFVGLDPPLACGKVGDRWEIGIGASDGSFQQVSYVNSICTIKGGQHVNYIADQVIQRLALTVKKRNKGAEIKNHQIKNHLSIYVNALIVNPAFDSQTKENLTTRPAAFGSTCVVPEKMLKELEKSHIVEKILEFAKFKQNAELKTKGGSKSTRVTGITKLDDANFAGTTKSNNCTLILTEGDSAKALAISGLGVVGRDYYGVFPLKGKLLNVREASHAQIMKNEEIQNVAKILGLTFGKVYETAASLRYGHLMIMTDQDHDGSHIKGLLINFLHHFWPSLLKLPGFLQQFITPIVKCTRGRSEEVFFTIPEYLNWRAAKEDGKGWSIKYYKGLGTSTSAEAKEYFSHLETHEINFSWGSDRSGDQIDMAFSKKRVEDRKQWLLAMQPGCFIDYAVDSITYDDFINHELILFSHADNERSLPHFMDGFKPSQRKVLFSCFKRNLRQEIKVAQLAGYISEHSAYHHGEASLTQTVIGMAQNFVGSNNINLLSPCGQFGTRLMGGKDAASPRYVFTKLENITRCIFHPHDDALLNYLDDDGQSIEPSFYVPIIPMALVNGSEGIGTGWSTSVPTYNPRDIIANLRRMITGELADYMTPWYRGFTGEIVSKSGKDSANYLVSGRVNQVDECTIVISELPVGKWTTDYKQMLESMTIGAAVASASKDDAGSTPMPQIIKSFKENHTDTTVLFTITLAAEKLLEILAEKGGLQKRFKLDGSLATTNMHMFDLDHHIRKFDNVKEIMDAFFEVRLDFYDRRKAHLIKRLTEEWDKLDNKVRFILAVVSGDLVVSNRKKTELLNELQRKGYKIFSAGKNEAEEVSSDEVSDDVGRGYDYLLSMKIWSLTLERVQSLTSERNTKHAELELLRGKSPEDLWLADLDALETALDEFENEIDAGKAQEKIAQNRANKASKNKKGGGARRRSRALDSDRSDEDEDDDFDLLPKKKKAAVKSTKPAATKTASAPVVVKATTSVPTVRSVESAQAKAAVSDKKEASKLDVIKPVVKSKPAVAKTAARPKTKVIDVDSDDNSEEDSEDDSAGESEEEESDCNESESSFESLAPVKAVSKPVPVPMKPVHIAPKTLKLSSKAADVIDLIDIADSEDESVKSTFKQKKAVLPKEKAPKAVKTVAPKVSKPIAPYLADLQRNVVEKKIAADPFDYGSESSRDDYQFKTLPIARPKASNSLQVVAEVPSKAKAVSKGVKRDKKEMPVSPSEASPMVSKKARKELAKAPTMSKAKPAAKKKQNRIVDSDEDEIDDVSVEKIAVTRSPKPVRARRPAAKTVSAYIDEEDDDDDEEEEDSDFE